MKMKIIENKKLFGKINVIDILLILIALVIFVVAYMIFGKSTVGTQNSRIYIFQYEMQNILKQTADSIQVGDKIYDNETNAYIGKVKSVDILQYEQVVANYETNELVSVVVPDKYNAVITIENNLIDEGADLKTEDEYIVKVGKKVYVRGGQYAGSGYIVYIER